MSKIKFCSIMFFMISFGFSSTVYAECTNLGEFLDDSNYNVIEYLKNLSNLSEGTKIDGIVLCDGSNPLNNLIFKEKLKTNDPKQNIYLFYKNGFCTKEDHHLIAIAWLENGGTEINLPMPTEDSWCGEEHAYVLSYDVFTWKKISNDKEVVIISYPTEEWVNSLI